MKPSYQNFTIIVNWKSKGFGCAKTCTYCNWRDSSLLPHGGQSTEAISAFISQCRKSFITISGGADPLYKFEEHSGELLAMIRVIQAHGFKVRILVLTPPIQQEPMDINREAQAHIIFLVNDLIYLPSKNLDRCLHINPERASKCSPLFSMHFASHCQLLQALWASSFQRCCTLSRVGRSHYRSNEPRKIGIRAYENHESPLTTATP